MRTPRLLPLVAVAVGGVLGIKALDAAGLVPDLLAATPKAFAASPAKPQKPAPQSTAAAQAPKPAAPICAPTAAELAKEAGLSPAELQMLQSLGTRRGQLDAREQALDTQMQLLNAAELKVDAKIKAMNAAKAQVAELVGQADAKTSAEVDRLVVVYEKMKPRDAGAIFATLDDRVRVPVAAKIAADKPAILGQILAAMGTLEAKKLTESLAHRFDAARAAAEAAQKVSPAVAVPSGAPAGKGKAVASADPAAAPDASDSAADADAPKADKKATPSVKPTSRRPVHAKPAAKVARAAPPKPSPAGDAKPAPPTPVASTAAATPTRAPVPAGSASTPAKAG